MPVDSSLPLYFSLFFFSLPSVTVILLATDTAFASHRIVRLSRHLTSHRFFRYSHFLDNCADCCPCVRPLVLGTAHGTIPQSRVGVLHLGYGPLCFPSLGPASLRRIVLLSALLVDVMSAFLVFLLVAVSRVFPFGGLSLFVKSSN